jgi:RNA polymerase sigma factor (sigma-70 family)
MGMSYKSDFVLTRYYEELSDPIANPLTPEEEKYHMTKYRTTKCPKSREKILNSCLRLVFNLAKRYWRDNDVETLKTLISAGSLGLLEALDRYDPDKGTKFSSYASFWILMNVRNELTDLKDLVRASSAVRKKRMLARKPGQTTTGAEPARLVYLDNNNNHSTVRLANFDTDACVATPEETYFSKRSEIDVKTLFIDWIRFLRIREQKVLSRYFGLYDNQPKSFREIAEETNLSSEMVRQIKEVSLNKLRRWFKYNGVTMPSHISSREGV